MSGNPHSNRIDMLLTVVADAVSMQEQAVFQALPDFPSVDEQDFHLDDWVLLRLTLAFTVLVTVVVAVSVSVEVLVAVILVVVTVEMGVVLVVLVTCGTG